MTAAPACTARSSSTSGRARPVPIERSVPPRRRARSPASQRGRRQRRAHAGAGHQHRRAQHHPGFRRRRALRRPDRRHFENLWVGRSTRSPSISNAGPRTSPTRSIAAWPSLPTSIKTNSNEAAQALGRRRLRGRADGRQLTTAAGRTMTRLTTVPARPWNRRPRRRTRGETGSLSTAERTLTAAATGVSNALKQNTTEVERTLAAASSGVSGALKQNAARSSGR